MNMNGKICQKLCALCGLVDVKYFVNSSELHGLCDNCAKALTELKMQCAHCKSSITIEYLKEVPPPKKCDRCGTIPAKNCQAKKHKFCSECRELSFQCPSCFCSICSSPSSSISICNFHSLCSPCSKKFINTCYICKCQICSKENPKQKFQGCKHPVCDSCIKLPICLICQKKCTYCEKICNVEKLICKKHPYCEDCEKKLIMKVPGCPECQGKTIKYKCFICKTPRGGNKSFCNFFKHAICEDCVLLKKTCQCTKCYGCEKLSECKEAPECKHLICSACLIGKKCKKCHKLCPCYNCGMTTERSKLFHCKKHFACEKCLNNKNECTKCSKTCSGCNKSKYNCKKISCEHYNCTKCLANNNNNGKCLFCLGCNNCKVKFKEKDEISNKLICVCKCLFCLGCNNCKVKFKEKDEIFNKLMCVYCSTRLKFFKEYPCVMCGSFCNLKSAQCRHNFCERCFDEWNTVCPPCKICRGCKNVIGNIKNKTNHLVCQVCFEGNKCCMQCMIEKKCINCGVLAKNLKKYACGIHKACKICFNKNYCPCALKCTNCQEFDIGESLSCLHFLCKKCKENELECVKQSMCLLCIKKCYVCKSVRNLSEIKCDKLEHILCNLCNPFENAGGCKACTDNLDFNECVECKKKNFAYALNCGKHKLCVKCKKNDSNDCLQCKEECFECKNPLQANEKLKCSHILCETCKDKHIQSCKLYQKVLCQVCKINQYQEKFSCRHKICKICLKDTNYCIICFSDCEACNLNKRVYKKCSHNLCSECLDDINQCVVCKENPDFFCDLCKNHKFKLQTPLKCGHKKCLDCENLSFSSSECNISICHYCGQCSKSCKMLAPCKNWICSNCIKYSDLETCPKCSKLLKHLCTFCKNPAKEYGLWLDQHTFSCVFCDMQACKQQCQTCRSPECFIKRCGHICYECFNTYVSCPLCRGYVLCNNNIHIIQLKSECKMCLSVQCSYCNNFVPVLLEGKLCKNCFKNKRECSNCNREYFINEIQGIQNENFREKNLCNICLKMLCLLCHKIHEELLDTIHKICKDCINKTNSRRQGLNYKSDSAIKGPTELLCPEFFKCSLCEIPTQKSLRLLMKPCEAVKQLCPKCLKLQQCVKCLKYFNPEDMGCSDMCLACAGLGICQICKKNEFLEYLTQSFKCRECAKLELCLKCNKLYPKIKLSDDNICPECIKYINPVVKNEFSISYNDIGNNEKICNFCHEIYTADTEDNIGCCLSCSQNKCQKCCKITQKNELDDYGNCSECSHKPCLNCGEMTRITIYDMNWGFCINCLEKVCCSCFSNANLMKMDCLHLECKNCRVPNSNKCSKCLRKFTCHLHKVVSDIGTDDTFYIFMNCCYSYYCIKCKTKYIGNYALHKGYCQG
ncbi:hypothetical protein SteCoe_30267 [Stentor coeruleus]|uniref:RING-type domain-containing protein n=1 Tax=Stentor coeruleus TaxID=5963 RepID=A0A1R2B3Z9_9CILI|nr:hypothetical protein SteCoe_30267 [Stentor coeruleus]